MAKHSRETKQQPVQQQRQEEPSTREAVKPDVPQPGQEDVQQQQEEAPNFGPDSDAPVPASVGRVSPLLSDPEQDEEAEDK